MFWWVAPIANTLARYLIWPLRHVTGTLGRTAGIAPDTAHFRPADGLADVDTWLAGSGQRPVWIFLHDPYCPNSRAARGEVARSGREVELVDVSRQQMISRAIERRTDVRHESPQLLLLRHGCAVWSASHFEITGATIAAAALLAAP